MACCALYGASGRCLLGGLWISFGECVGDGLGHGGVVEAETVGEAGDLAGDVVGGHGGDQGSGGAQGVDLAFGVAQPAAPPGDFRVDDQVGERPGLAR